MVPNLILTALLWLVLLLCGIRISWLELSLWPWGESCCSLVLRGVELPQWLLRLLVPAKARSPLYVKRVVVDLIRIKLPWNWLSSSSSSSSCFLLEVHGLHTTLFLSDTNDEEALCNNGVATPAPTQQARRRPTPYSRGNGDKTGKF